MVNECHIGTPRINASKVFIQYEMSGDLFILANYKV